MSRRPLASLAAPLCALALILGGIACSGDDDAPAATPPAAGQGSGDSDSDSDSDSVGDGDGDEGRPFDVGREDLALALASATSASDHRVDGETIHLVYDSGSKDDPKASINCSVARELKSDDDRVVLDYPDGTVDCEVDDRGEP